MSLLIDQLDRYAVIAAVINLSSIFVIRFMLLKWKVIIYRKPYILILLTACNSVSMENVIKCIVYNSVNPLSANPTKWSNTLKQFVSNFPTNFLSVFDRFVKTLNCRGTGTLFEVQTQKIIIITTIYFFWKLTYKRITQNMHTTSALLRP